MIPELRLDDAVIILDLDSAGGCSAGTLCRHLSTFFGPGYEPVLRARLMALRDLGYLETHVGVSRLTQYRLTARGREVLDWNRPRLQGLFSEALAVLR